jgi:hypothetical protein
MATLQETYKKHVVGRAPKQTKKRLYEFLDGFDFVDQFEIQDAILHFCKIKAPSYAELIRADEVADEYITKRKLENIYILPF